MLPGSQAEGTNLAYSMNRKKTRVIRIRVSKEKSVRK